MSLLPEEPLKNACVGGMSVADNLAFREFDRAPFAIGGWWLNRAAFRADAERKIGRYKIKTRTPDTPISSLSGGKRPARGAGARTGGRRRGADRRQTPASVWISPRWRRSTPRSWPREIAAPRCCW